MQELPQEQQQLTCIICMNQAQNPVNINSCTHIFCHECIIRWGQTCTNLCPVCRNPFNQLIPIRQNQQQPQQQEQGENNNYHISDRELSIESDIDEEQDQQFGNLDLYRGDICMLCGEEAQAHTVLRQLINCTECNISVAHPECLGMNQADPNWRCADCVLHEGENDGREIFLMLDDGTLMEINFIQQGEQEIDDDFMEEEFYVNDITNDQKKQIFEDYQDEPGVMTRGRMQRIVAMRRITQMRRQRREQQIARQQRQIQEDQKEQEEAGAQENHEQKSDHEQEKQQNRDYQETKQQPVVPRVVKMSNQCRQNAQKIICSKNCQATPKKCYKSSATKQSNSRHPPSIQKSEEKNQKEKRYPEHNYFLRR